MTTTDEEQQEAASIAKVAPQTDSASSNHDSDEISNEEDAAVDELANQIQATLNLNSKTSEKDKVDDDIPEQLRKIAEWIQSSNRIVVLTGAGVSVAAGIPDFRTPGTGLYVKRRRNVINIATDDTHHMILCVYSYDNLQKYNLPYPEAVFDVSFYRRNPKPFCSLAKEIWPGLTHSPTLTHSFLALLDKKQKLTRLYTQNIDGLEFLAEIAPKRLVECHGHFRTASCIECGKSANGEMVKTTIVHDGKTPTCKKCHGHVKPDIVFFGEGLPERFSQLLPHDLDQADLMLVMGTSLQVAPVSMIPSMVKGRRILLNREVVGDFGTGKEDVYYLGDCDDSVQIIANLLGWSDELSEQNEKTRITKKQQPLSK
jgi:NAD-dependent SIR2 family protein deacetylase